MIWNLVLIKKKEHSEIFSKVVSEHDENKINELNQCLTEKWDHVMPLPAYFHGQLILWVSLCMQQLWFTMDNFSKQP